MEQLAGGQDDYAIYAPSPFSIDNRLIMIAADTSTKYTRRTATEYNKIVFYIYNFITAKVGNYMVFFPSYKMMDDIIPYLKDCFYKHGYSINSDSEYIKSGDAKICIYQQNTAMDEQERENFYQSLQTIQTTLQ